MNAFTPGPWTLGRHGKNTRRIDAKTARIPWSGLAKVYVRCGGAPSSEGEANARLIAAAPDLYEALCAVRDGETLRREHAEFALSDELLAAIDAALAKVTP